MIIPTLPSWGRSKQRGVMFQFVRFIWLFMLLASASSFRAAVPDVQLYTVTKGRWHQQLNSGTPTFLPTGEYVFQANTYNTSNRVRSAFVESTSNFIDRDLTKQDPTQWQYRIRVDDPSDLDPAYPNGNYRFYITTANQGTRTPVLSLNTNYPSTPHIANYDDLQNASGTGYVVVTWDPWTGGRSNDFIQLRVLLNGTKVFETRDFGETNALDGTATRSIIQPGKLKRNTTYTGRLEFRKTSEFDYDSYPGAIGWAYFHRRTEFTFHTSLDGPPDVSSYDVSKGHSFVQTNLAAPLPEGSNAFAFSASLQSSFPGGIIGNTLTLPNGSVTNLSAEDCRPDTQLQLSATSSSSNGLDASFPDGTYTFDIQTAHQGEHVVSLDLLPAYYPPAPYIRDFDPSVAVPADQPIPLKWDAWPDGTARDFIQLRLASGCSNIFETGDFGSLNALNGTATSVTIPAGYVVPGTTLNARLTFRRIVDLDADSYRGALGSASFYSRTKFDITGRLDAESYAVAKGHRFVQTNTIDVVPDGTNAFQFLAQVDAQTPSSVLSSFLRLPDGNTITMISDGLGQFTHSVFSSNSLDAAFPDGTYTIELQTEHDGPKSLPLSLQGNAYPPAPQFIRDPAVRIPPGQPVQVYWNPWAGGANSDFVQLRIRNGGTNIWETPDLGEEGALTGLANYASIPAGVLSKGQSYTARLTFWRIVDTEISDYPGSTGLAYYFSRTDIDLKTVKPDIESYSIEKGQSFLLRFEEQPEPEEGFQFLFNATVKGSTSNVVTSAKMVAPNNRTYSLIASPPDKFEQADIASTKALLDLNYPVGTYRFEVATTNDGTNILFLSLTNSPYPPAPNLINYNYGNILGATAIPLEWDPWVGGTTNDFVQVQLRDAGTNVWETPNFGAIGALNGLSNNIVIPEGVTGAGKHYTIRVIFRRFVTIEEAQPGTVGTVSYFSRTKVDLFTAPQDVSSYSIFKGREYFQTNATIIIATGFVFTATVVASDTGLVRSVSIITPRAETINIPLLADMQTHAIEQVFASQQALDARFPDGAYILAIDGATYGPTNVTIYLTNAAYPNAPYIINYDAAGRIGAANDFELLWNPFVGATAQDVAKVTFGSLAGGKSFTSKPPTEQGGIDAMATSIIIPGGSLSGNDVLLATVLFEKVLLDDETTYSEVPGRAGYYSRTTFKALTSGAGNPPQLPLNQFNLFSGRVQFIVTTIPTVTYVIEGSSDLLNWSALSTFTAIDQRHTFSASTPVGPFFYRVRLVR